MISVRLDSRTEEELKRVASAQGVTKSEYVRQMLVDKLAEEQNQPSAWELGKDVFGKYSSGRSDLSTRRKELVKEKIRAKHSRH